MCVCRPDELASTLAVVKSLCVLNKRTGSGPAALASVGLGLDNRGRRIKTRGRSARVILLARIPSALPARPPAAVRGRGKRQRQERGGRGGGGAELYGWRQQQQR